MPSSLFISDLHLSGERPEINEQFFGFLSHVAAGASALYVLGDLFDYWIGDDELDSADGDPLARKVADGLHRLSESGVALYLMHGNRDFLLGERFLAASGAALLDDPARLEVDGHATLLMHGDTLCTDDVAYQRFRLQARSAAWQRQVLAEPLSARRARMASLRETSEQVKRDTPMAIMDVSQEAVHAAFRMHNVDRLIHGHTHRPGRHSLEIDGRACERWVLPDWYQRGGYLEITSGAPRLVRF